MRLLLLNYLRYFLIILVVHYHLLISRELISLVSMLTCLCKSIKLVHLLKMFLNVRVEMNIKLKYFITEDRFCHSKIHDAISLPWFGFLPIVQVVR